MKVCAAPGLQCPKEGKPKEHIDDNPEGVEVADSSYYRRLVSDGSLLEVKPAAESAPAAVAPVGPVAPVATVATPATAASVADKKEGGDQ